MIKSENDKELQIKISAKGDILELKLQNDALQKEKLEFQIRRGRGILKNLNLIIIVIIIY